MSLNCNVLLATWISGFESDHLKLYYLYWSQNDQILLSVSHRFNRLQCCVIKLLSAITLALLLGAKTIPKLILGVSFFCSNFSIFASLSHAALFWIHNSRHSWIFLQYCLQLFTDWLKIGFKINQLAPNIFSLFVLLWNIFCSLEFFFAWDGSYLKNGRKTFVRFSVSNF